MEIGLSHYLTVGAILLVLGVLGIFLNRKNLIVILMAIELILLAVNINLVAFSAALNDLVGQVFAMFVLTVAAGEADLALLRAAAEDLRGAGRIESLELVGAGGAAGASAVEVRDIVLGEAPPRA